MSFNTSDASLTVQSNDTNPGSSKTATLLHSGQQPSPPLCDNTLPPVSPLQEITTKELKPNYPEDQLTEPAKPVDPVLAFQTRVDTFMKEHSYMYDKLMFDFDHKDYERDFLCDHAPRPPIDPTTENYCVPDPPLESYMEVDSAVRRDGFFKLVKIGDIIKGIILSSSATSGVSVQVLSFDESMPKLRVIADLKIKGVVEVVNIAIKETERGDALDDLFRNDIIKAVVVNVKDEVLGLSLRRDHLNKGTPTTVTLGYVKDDESFSTSASTKSLEPASYLRSLEASSGFNNPNCVENLKDVFCISEGIRNTLLEHILLKKFPDVEYSEGLKYLQKKSWSLRLTKSAIKYFKRNRTDLAKAYLDYAVNIDSFNIEALVARGALFANRQEYEKSIRNFQDAMDLSLRHKNARKYFVETSIAYAEKLESEKDLVKALKYYKKALSVDATSEKAKEKTESLSTMLQKQAADKEENKRKKAEEQLRLKKLRRIVRRERRKMRESEIHGPKEKPQKSEKKKKRRSKTKRRRSSSPCGSKSKRRKKYDYSSDDYDSTDSESSSAGSRRRRSLRKKK